MAIGGWRSGIPRPGRRRRIPPPPPPPAGHPIWTELPEDQASTMDRKNEQLRGQIRETAAIVLKDPSKLTSSMDAQNAARKSSGQTATVK